MIAISVNVSRDDLYKEDLLDVLNSLVTKYEIDPKQLHLEIIERAYVDDSDHMYQILTKLREQGFIIEMDDFGTGESSLAMVADMPIDYIKLDRQFLVSGLDDKRHIEVIRAMINLAKTLDVEVLAEGIETKEQEEILYKLGCRYAQGYFYGKPAPDIDFE
jgi:EAL domain-containing protein (putative c-di-GMP-specific phosphodiesterase class I)